MIGYLFAAVCLVQAGGHVLAHRVRRVSVFAQLGVLFVSGAVLLVAVYGTRWLVPVGLMLYFGLSSLVGTLLAGRLQKAIRGGSRATVTSVCAAAGEISGIAIVLVFGWCATGYGMGGGTLFVAVAAMLLSVGFAVLARRWGMD